MKFATKAQIRVKSCVSTARSFLGSVDICQCTLEISRFKVFIILPLEIEPKLSDILNFSTLHAEQGAEI